MENCTIYSHILDFESIERIVKHNLPKAKVEVKDGGKQKSLVATIKGGFFSKTKKLTINYRERKTPSYKLSEVDCPLTQNLAGMVNFIQSIPSQNEEVKNKFMIKVMAANCEMSFMAAPSIDKDFEPILRSVMSQLNGFIFAQPSSLFSKSGGQHFVDKDLNLILDTNGNCEVDDIDVTVDAKYHDQPVDEYKQDQIDRKARSEAYLSTHNIKVNKNLPCSASESTIELRSVKEVIDRAYALLIMAVKGEGVVQKQLEKTVKDRNINGFSPKEETIYRSEILTDTQRAYATWRYESLYTVLWALGKMEDLKYPSDICNVQEVVGKVLTPSVEEFAKSAQLKSKSEILDELDKIYRMNWSCVDARIKGEEVAGNINPSVIYERHYALNWLTRYQDQDWDDVKTNT